MIKRILIYGISILFCSLVIYNFYYKNKINSLTQEIYKTKSDQINKLFNNEVEKKFGKTFALTYLLSKDEKLINAIVTKNRKLLNYTKIINDIENYGEYKNLWIQIVDKDGYSFYRSWTKKVGDHAASARLDIADMLKNPKPKRGISTGRFDMTFKTMIPLYNGKEFIGMIEMISKFNSIAKLLKDNKIESLMVVHEDYTKRFIKPFSGLFIGNNYIANQNASPELIKKVEKYGLKKLMYLNEPLLFEKYLLSTSQIKDVHGGDMGFFLFFSEESELDKSLIYNFEIDYFFKVIIVLIILILLILYLFYKKYAKQLTSEVASKTLKIKKQQERLKSLLEIYDNNVIFSKTDLKGNITHVSNAFCEISGYTKEELIGKAHNCVRHPSMPKHTFSTMWKTIQSEKVWRGEVQNLKKDGSFYWVDAEIEPVYDQDNKVKGYSAIRQNITDAKEIEEIQREIIFAMGSIGESRSNETGNHVKRVAEYSKILALKYGLGKDESEMLREASPMHDIGKVGIPDSILKKPGILDDEEREIMKTHANIGFNMLNSSTRPLLKTAAIVALEHHEKWDGTGYPRGLEGEDIHIYGRITAIADVFDALGSNRCYKKAWEDEKIFQYFKEEQGKYFDPKLVEIFFKNLDLFLDVRDRFKDS